MADNPAYPPPTTRTYGEDGAVERRGKVASVFVREAEAQVSALHEGDGFMVRIFPPGGTHEFGGDNLTCLTAIVRFTPDSRTVLEHMEWLPRPALTGPLTEGVNDG